LYTKLLPYPADNYQADCIDTEAKDFKNFLKSENYTSDACFLECELKYMQRKCGCRVPQQLGMSPIFKVDFDMTAMLWGILRPSSPW